jgi:hypothetical protein
MDIKTFPRIDVHFAYKNKETGEEGLSPDKMYIEALKIKNKFIEDKTHDTNDSIYLVADVDHFMNDLLKIRPLCLQGNIKLIISNSCFEIWLFYGKSMDKPVDFIIPDEKLKISSAFKAYLGKKFQNQGGINPKKAILDIHEAIKNAKHNYKEDENCIPTLFSTNMFILAENLLPLIEPELQNLLQS